MKLLAISDLHVGFPNNLAGIKSLGPHPGDWLIVAGDVAEDAGVVQNTLELLSDRFDKVIWVPGNHELWSVSPEDARGERKYLDLVARCRKIGVLTPEDPFPTWAGEGGGYVVAPLFLLYDYSFADDGVSSEEALRRARDAGIVCADEGLLHPDPFPTRGAWCKERCRLTEARLQATVDAGGGPLVLVNHFPLKRELAVLPMIPAFKIWCGTRLTENWATRFGARVVVSGHLHIRSTRTIDGVRFEEVSLGYPKRNWNVSRGVEPYLRQILPEPSLDGPSRVGLGP